MWLGAACEVGPLSAGGGAAGEEPPALLTQSSFSRRRTENFCASSFTGPPPTSPRRTTLLSEYTGAGAATWRVISLPNEAADAGLVQDTQTAGPPATQPPQPADAAAVAMESIRALRDAEKAEKEMSTNDITSKLGQLHAALGEYAFLAPTRGDLLHAQQLRKLHTELIKNGLVQSDPTLEPHKLKLMGGDDGVAACKAEKEKDVEAADAHDVLEYRCRCSGLVHSIGLVTIGEPGGAEIYKGAFAIVLALGDATRLSCR